MPKFFYSLKFKLSLLLIIIIVLPLVFWGVYSYLKITESDKKNASEFIITSLRNTSENVDDILYNIEFLAASIVFDEQLLNNLKSLYEYDALISYQDYVAQNQLLSFIFNKKSASRYINSIYLFSYKSRKTYSSIGNYRIIDEDNTLRSKWYNSFQNDGNWITTESLNKTHSLSDHILAFYKEIFQFSNNNTPIGIISFNVSENYIYQYLQKTNPTPDYESLIIDTSGTIISSTNRDTVCLNVKDKRYISNVLSRLDEGYFIDSIDNEKKLVAFYTSQYNNWKYVTVVPYKTITKSATYAKSYFQITYVFLIIIILFIIIIVSAVIYHPIKLLFKTMKKVGDGNFDTSLIQHNRKDELGYIFDKFNQMIRRINSLINDLYIMQLVKKEAQLKAIYTEINEHFLYNTLDFIHWSAKAQGAKDINDITFNLSKFFRLSLNNGSDMATISSIVTMMECYLNILMLRFKDKLTIEMHIDNDIKDIYVLKYIFQPIVENAFKHGIETKKGKGYIKIAFTKENGLIKFSVQDNGVGIPEPKLEEIKESLKTANGFSDTHNTHENFALKNITTQIKMFYGDQYNIEMSSTFGKGTLVELKIPIKDME